MSIIAELRRPPTPRPRRHAATRRAAGGRRAAGAGSLVACRAGRPSTSSTSAVGRRAAVRRTETAGVWLTVCTSHTPLTAAAGRAASFPNRRDRLHYLAVLLYLQPAGACSRLLSLSEWPDSLRLALLTSSETPRRCPRRRRLTGRRRRQRLAPARPAGRRAVSLTHRSQQSDRPAVAAHGHSHSVRVGSRIRSAVRKCRGRAHAGPRRHS